MAQRFEDLEVWKKSKDLCSNLYQALSKCKDYFFRDHILKSALSIPSNIAEGFERNSNKEFIRFLLIAKGSCGELRTQIIIGVEIGILGREEGARLIKTAEEISYMINAFIQKRKSFQSS